MRNVLVVLFWLWVLAAVGVYAYRIFRRVTHGPKRERTSASTGATGSVEPDAPGAPGAPGDTTGAGTGRPRRGGLLAGLSTPPPPPLPDGPVEARLPKALQDRPLPAAPGDAAPADGPGRVESPAAATADAVPPAAPQPTLAEALAGIRMPDELLPVVDAATADLDAGRQASFAGTGTNVPTVAVAIGDELKRLGYVVDGLETITSTRAGLSAHRDGTTVAASVGLDDDTGAVVLRLRT